jgi:hypothetical protein
VSRRRPTRASAADQGSAPQKTSGRDIRLLFAINTYFRYVRVRKSPMLSIWHSQAQNKAHGKSKKLLTYSSRRPCFNWRGYPCQPTAQRSAVLFAGPGDEYLSGSGAEQQDRRPGADSVPSCIFQCLLRNTLQLHFSSRAGGTPGCHRTYIGGPDFQHRPTQLFGFVKSSNAAQIQFSVIPPSGTATIFDQPILYYVDGGQTPIIQFTSGVTNFNPAAGQNLTLVGYELDCNAAPCAAIATQ